MRTRSSILLTCLILGTAHAQTTPPANKVGVAALPTPDGAMLRWYLPGDVVPTKGFRVRVTDPGGDRIVNVASLPPYTAALGVSREEYKALSAIYSRPPAGSSEQVQRALFNLNVLARPAYAQVLGISTTLKGLSPGPHTVTVEAIGGGGATRVGQTSFRTGPTPDVPAPTGVKASGNQAKVTVEWAAIPDNDRALVVAYVISRSVAGGPFQVLEPTPYFPTAGQGFQDTTTQPGERYAYQVTSVDLFGRQSVPSTPVMFKVPGVARQVPGLVTAVASNMAVTLSWAPEEAQDSALVILRGTDPNTLSVLGRVPAGTTQYVDRSVEGGVNYYYSVAAPDASGQVRMRSALTTAPGLNLTPPSAPAGVKLIPGENALTLTWTPGPEKDLRGYLVYRFEGRQTSADEVLLTGTPIQATSYQDGIPQGVQTRYSYRVVAVNTSQAASPPSPPVTAALLDKTPPPVPLLNPAQVEGDAVQLTWMQAEVPDLAQFELTRSEGGQTVVLARVGADARTYLDKAARPGASYTYTLTSVDQSGNQSERSDAVAARLPMKIGTLAPPQASVLPGGGVQLTWEASGPALYVVYRLSGDQAIDISGLLTSSTFTDSSGTAGARYAVSAVTPDGEIGPPSQPSQPAR